ncbi:MAG TPA: hypothetical protein VFQ39_02915 [Longimicrobium sp.]|nr:hypothetical protein [Longimicrobium sp.]
MDRETEIAVHSGGAIAHNLRRCANDNKGAQLKNRRVEAEDLCFIGNFQAVHGPTPFKARYEVLSRF